jgi:predicted nucleic acid-binding protein
MKDKVFIDTNILVYDYLITDAERHGKAKTFLFSLIGKDVCISTQVLNETYSALKKNGVSNEDARYYIEYCIMKYVVLTVSVGEIQTCLTLREKYNYSYWDCLILATAINNDCSFLYSEDMQNRHIIHTGLEIINPLT